MDNRFGWCFIGTGTLAKNVAEEIIPSGRHRIVSVFSRHLDKSEAFAREVGAQAYAAAKDAIAADGVDGVYIVTTHDSHYEYAKLALEMGKNVLCEKPMTMTAGEAKKLMALAAEKGLYIAEAMWTWFNPVANKVADWVEEGRFGKISEVYHFCHTDGINYAPRVTDPNTAGGAVLDMGVYALTYMRRLFGRPESLRCEGDLRDGIDWGEEVELFYPDGKKAHISLCINDLDHEEHFDLTGDKASLLIPRTHQATVAVLRAADGTEERFAAEKSYLNEFDIVAAEMRAQLPDSRYSPHAVTIDVMEMIDECRRQMQLVYPFEAPDLWA